MKTEFAKSETNDHKYRKNGYAEPQTMGVIVLYECSDDDCRGLYEDKMPLSLLTNGGLRGLDGTYECPRCHRKNKIDGDRLANMAEWEIIKAAEVAKKSRAKARAKVRAAEKRKEKEKIKKVE